MILFMWRKSHFGWHCIPFYLSNKEEAEKERKTLLSLGWKENKPK